MPRTGEKPGKGIYFCKNCGVKITLDDTTDTMPPCPSCNGTEFNDKEEKMATTGEKPGKGTYKCTKCSQTVTLDDTTDTLPPCPKCKNTEFTKI